MLASSRQSPNIRVAIFDDVASLGLKINGFYQILDSLNHRVLYRGKNLKTTVTTTGNSILVGESDLKANKILINSDDPQAIMIDGRLFRGDIELIKKSNSRLLVVNQINLEDYVKGILYHEASHYWPKEALKAQAVACRTYAAYQMQVNRLKDYDLTADIYSQVYGGRSSERYRTNIAVEETRDEVLSFNGKLFPAYYHATCAGHTEDAALLWNIDLAPLKGVVCPFCQGSPHFNWHTIISQEELIKLLKKGGSPGLKNIKEILIPDRDKSGRIINLGISDGKKEIKISAKNFRNIIGPNMIKSTNFTVGVVNQDIVFQGLGWGHGVGLCQWGGYFMAKQGYNYRQILGYYYPLSKISSLTKE